MLQSGGVAFVVFCIAFVVALVAGAPELGSEGNLVQASMPVEEWWFWWYSALIAQLPPAIAPYFYVAFPVLLLVSMLLLPWLDRGPARGVRKRPVWAAFVVLCVGGMLWLSYLRTQSPWTGWPDPTPTPLPAGVVLSEQAETGRELFAVYGCNSCHAIASQGRQVGPDLSQIQHRMSQQELRSFILAPSEDVAMPSYQGRIADADLARIVDFVLAAQTFPRE
jgi:cytochrome c551/c552